jgi:hypothetical protein
LTVITGAIALRAKEASAVYHVMSRPHPGPPGDGYERVLMLGNH